MKKLKLLTLGILLLTLILPGLAFSQSASPICIPRQALDGLISDSQELGLYKDLYRTEQGITTTLSRQLTHYQAKSVSDSLISLSTTEIARQQNLKLTELNLQAARNNTKLSSLATQRNMLAGTSLSLGLLLTALYFIR